MAGVKPPPSPPQLLFHPTTVAAAIEALTDGIFELRCLKATFKGDPRGGYIASGWFDNIDHALVQLDRLESCSGIYFTLNELDPALLARAKPNELRAIRGRDPLTADHDIVRRRWLPIDVDPIRPAGVASTDAEHAAAAQVALAIRAQLGEWGFPTPVSIDSGNGAHLLYRVDLSPDDGGRVAGFLAHLDAWFSTATVKVDTSVHNPARIWRLPGTLNAKGYGSEERPHRRAEADLQPRGSDTLPEGALDTFVQKTGAQGALRGSSVQTDLGAWLTAVGLAHRGGKPWKGAGTLYELEVCPWNAEHCRGGAWVAQHPTGATAAG